MADSEAKPEKVTSLTRKLANIFENQLSNDTETLEALKELSTFVTENNIQTRRNLRGNIERRNLAINQEIYEVFNKVKEALDDVYSEIKIMDDNCKEMSSKLSATKTRTQQLMSQMTSFRSTNNKLSMEQQVTAKMIESFQLSPSEVSVLCNADESITEEFFAALFKAKGVHHRCKEILHCGHQATALEIMEQMALYQERALERLYRWTQVQCRNSVDSSEGNVLLTQAITCLQDRPVLLKYVIDEYCTARKAVVVRSFLDALTVGGLHGTPRPMELHAHDPPRYVGDMLAWLHQMTPTEKESAHSLLKGCDKSDVNELVKSALSNITEGLCRPLRLRLEQIISADIGPSVLHTLVGLIRFYLNTVEQVVGDSPLVETLTEMYALYHHTFLSTLELHVCRLLEKTQPPNQDLSPSNGVNLLLNLLRDVLSGGHITDAQANDMTNVVNRVVDPLLQYIENAASRLPAIDQSAYTLNCIYQIHSSLSLYEYVDIKLESLQSLMENQIAVLSTEQATSLIHSLGLGSVCSILQNKASEEVMSNIPGMDPASLHSFLMKLDALLSSPEALQLPQWRLLISGTQRKTIQRKALDAVLSIYSQLYEAVHNPINCYENPSSLMPSSPDQVRALLA